MCRAVVFYINRVVKRRPLPCNLSRKGFLEWFIYQKAQFVINPLNGNFIFHTGGRSLS